MSGGGGVWDIDGRGRQIKRKRTLVERDKILLRVVAALCNSNAFTDYSTKTSQ